MADISKIKVIDGTEYDLKDETARTAANSKTAVIANPTLAGSETALTAIQIDNTKYKLNNYAAVAFSKTLTSSSWSSNAQTISDANFVVSGYSYIVTPAGSDSASYNSAQIYADNVSVSGEMTFHCTTVPSSNLTVNILRVVSS